MREDVSATKLNTPFGCVSTLISPLWILPVALKIYFWSLFLPSQIVNCVTTSLETAQMFKTLRNCSPWSSSLLSPFPSFDATFLALCGHPDDSKSMVYTQKQQPRRRHSLLWLFFFKLNQILSVFPLVTLCTHTLRFLLMCQRGGSGSSWLFFTTSLCNIRAGMHLWLYYRDKKK